MKELTGFQYDALVVLAAGEEYGLGIKRELEDYYEEEVNHGRLYPNLDDLVEEGLVEKGKRDDRTNSYRLTEEGRQVIEGRRSWEDEYIEAGETDIADELEE